VYLICGAFAIVGAVLYFVLKSDYVRGGSPPSTSPPRHRRRTWPPWPLNPGFTIYTFLTLRNRPLTPFAFLSREQGAAIS
jgi:hypothetical protein